MDTVLVTGGCGYIGSHTAICLIKNGFNVVLIDSFINSFKSSYKKILKLIEKDYVERKNYIKLIEGDLRDEKLLTKIFLDQKESGNEITSVIHFAGLKSISESIHSPLEYWNSNIVGTLSLLKTMEKFKCYSIIFSSSASVYKINSTTLLKEGDLLEPSNPYGKTKLTIEKILEDIYLSNKKNWKIANLRYFNPAGAHESGLLEEKPKGDFSNLFPAINKVLRKEKEKLLIFGNDWPTKDGTCIRDYIHVMDLAEAHYSSLDYLLKKEPEYLSINIGTGTGSSILDILNNFNDLGFNIPKKFVDRRSGDYPFIVADNNLALKLLNWSPKRNLKDMCIDFLNSFLDK